MEKIY